MFKHQEMHTTSLNLCICANESFTSDFFLQKEHATQLIIVHLICELTTPINKTLFLYVSNLISFSTKPI